MKAEEQKDPSEFEEIIGIKFNDRSLLKQAFTHRSYLNELNGEEKGKVDNNERLEFLGDAVIELIVTDHIFHNYPQKKEGPLTSFRSAVVSTSSLASIAGELKVGKFLRTSLGETKDSDRARENILADTFEAVVGAIYLDRGYEKVAEFISENLFPYLEDIVNKQLWRDAKSQLQEKVQDKVGITPYYEVLDERGPDHDKLFTVGVYFEDEEVARGEGKSKQEAEQDAASNALNIEEWSDNDN